MGRRGKRAGRAAAALLTATLVLAAGAAAQQIVPSPNDGGNPFCLKPNEETPEIYGPTDVGASLASDRLSVAVNPHGSLSVFRWPSRSYWEQLRYFTVDRDLPRLGLEPNEGAFSGLALQMRGGGRRFVWLRDLPVVQRYASGDSDTVLTRYRSRSLGFRAEIADVLHWRSSALMRRHVLRLDRGSRVRRATLVAFANLNPTASKRPLLPTEDWCEELGGSDRAAYDAAADAVVYSIAETDQSSGRRRSVAVAIGANVRSSGHQIGADRYTRHPSAAAGPRSAYDDAADGRLAGNSRLGPAEVDSALSFPLGPRPVTVIFAAAADGSRAVSLLRRTRKRSPVAAARAKRRSYRSWLRAAPLPRAAPPAVARLARRALVSLRQVIDTRAGPRNNLVAVMASVTTQAPYFLDWIRDGAFFNEALDVIGRHGLVARHNRFYAEVQKKEEEGAPPGTPLSVCQQPTPAGNWFMTNYADGGDAGVFTWEIDEAGFGLWTLWRHFVQRRARGLPAKPYLRTIYPAIRRTAEFLVAFRDPRTKLPPGTACEDDNPPRPGQPTMHSAGPVLLAMRSAEWAANALGRDADAARYRARRLELEQAIDVTFRTAGGAWTANFGDGGWALWPVRVKPYRHPRSRAQAAAAWEAVRPSFLAPHGPKRRGQYEAKALHGLARFYRATDPRGLSRVRRGLRWIAEVQAAYQRTGILGEAWYVRGGRVISVVAQPHVWEQVLFYLAALDAYGRRPFDAGGSIPFLRPRR